MRRRRGGCVAVRRFASLAAIAAFILPTAGLRAQTSGLGRACGSIVTGDALAYCNLVAQTLEVTQSVATQVAAGGNPVPGSASTLGMRIGTAPRYTVAGRVTAAWADVPEVARRDAVGASGAVFGAMSIEGGVGLFNGFTTAPTIGGVGAVDLLASLGFLFLPGDRGFRSRTPYTFGVGARLGFLRESFTVPGVSVSAMYRRIGSMTLGDPNTITADGYFTTNPWVLSLRGTVGKRIAAVGLLVGGGYDRASSDVRLGVAGSGLGGPVSTRLDGFATSRYSAFLNASVTALVLHGVLELGWLGGGDRVSDVFPSGVSFDPGRGSFYGSLAARLTI
ncbi:MAG TPA: hypothetical protein VKZ58_03770 [Longimicrobiales bacterium]|nr:hypothetical protein [Longimicrobiales bacterium]